MKGYIFYTPNLYIDLQGYSSRQTLGWIDLDLIWRTDNVALWNIEIKVNSTHVSDRMETLRRSLLNSLISLVYRCRVVRYSCMSEPEYLLTN